jgi:hypothetical protein
MSDHQRGKVVKATFEIEYPDGSTKVSEIDNPQDVGYIAFDEAHIRENDRGRYNVSESDWKENPAMMIYARGADVAELGIPFCTHNGCKG